MDATSDSRTLAMTVLLKAPPERVFDAWTDPALLLQWWGPEGTTTPEHLWDLRVGGRWRTAMQRANGERNTASGVYTLIERPRRLTLTWAWEQADGSRGHETIVDVRFEAVETGTRLLLEQKRFANAEQRGFHSQGWESSFRKLQAFVE